MCNAITFDNNCFCREHQAKISNQKFDKPDECPICLCDLKEEEIPLSCGHWVHRKCQIKWNDICPLCRRKIELTGEEREQMNDIKKQRALHEEEEDDSDDEDFELESDDEHEEFSDQEEDEDADTDDDEEDDQEEETRNIESF